MIQTTTPILDSSDPASQGEKEEEGDDKVGDARSEGRQRKRGKADVWEEASAALGRETVLRDSIVRDASARKTVHHSISISSRREMQGSRWESKCPSSLA